MKIEICDLCEKKLGELNRTEVIIKDYKGMTFEYGVAHQVKRKFKGTICDDCLTLLREKHKQ